MTRRTEKDNANTTYYSGGYEDPVKYLRIDKVHRFLEKHIEINPKTKILDIGCFGSHLLYKLHKTGFSKLFGIDVIDIRNKYPFAYNFSKEDIEKRTSFSSSTFDVVVMSHVLEHLYDVPAAVEEIRRILKKNGHFILCLPLDTNLFARISILFNKPVHDPFTTGTHIKIYKFDNTIKSFKKHGFKVESVDYSFINYGRYDQKIPFLKKIAALSPNHLSSEVVFLFKKTS